MATTRNESVYFLCVNVSEDTVTDAFKLMEELQSHHLALTVFYLLFLVVGLPWNLLVVGTIVKEKLYTQPTIILLLNLVLTDLCALLLVTPFVVVTGLAGEYVFGGSDRVRCEVCRADLIVEHIFQISSFATITVIAFDRFFFIHKPLHYERLVTAKRMLVTVLVMWCGCVLYVLFHLILLGDVRFSPLSLQCLWDTSHHEYFHIVSILAIILFYLVILVCNIWVVCIVLSNIRAVYKVQKTSRVESSERRVHGEQMMTNSRMQHTRNRKQLHLMRVFGGIICSNTISWLPTAVLALLSLLVTTPYVVFSIPVDYITTCTILFAAQVVIYPILETTLISDIRIPMKKIVMCGFSFRGSSSATLTNEEEGECCCCCYGDDTSACCGRGCLEMCDSIWLPVPSRKSSSPNPEGGISEGDHSPCEHSHRTHATIETLPTRISFEGGSSL